MIYMFCSFMIVISCLIGFRLYGESVIKQIQSGMFFGFALGCGLIMVFA